MIYSEMVKKAVLIAFDAHSGVFDDSGMPYVLHPLHLAEHFYQENLVITSLLHDVVEDTDWTIERLQEQGFDQEILIALTLLTHKEGLSYAEYIDNLKDNDIARKVKIADLLHNMDASRTPKRAEYFAKKTEACYKPALALLTEIENKKK